MSDPIWLPCAAMVGLTAAVWVKLYADRLGEMRAKRIDPQALASARATAQLERPQAAENFRNLFELPVLFYLALVVAALTAQAGTAVLVLAWLFVALRVVHSAIHCSYNKVMHRFQAYLAGCIVLWLLWAVIAFGLLRG